MADDRQADDGGNTVSITLYPDDSSEKAIRQLGYGITPFVLIEPEYVEETDTSNWTIVGSWVEDMSELVDFMEAALDVVKAAIEQNAERPYPPVSHGNAADDE